jgi:hypothetical protein
MKPRKLKVTQRDIDDLYAAGILNLIIDDVRDYSREGESVPDTAERLLHKYGAIEFWMIDYRPANHSESYAILLIIFSMDLEYNFLLIDHVARECFIVWFDATYALDEHHLIGVFSSRTGLIAEAELPHVDDWCSFTEAENMTWNGITYDKHSDVYDYAGMLCAANVR